MPAYQVAVYQTAERSRYPERWAGIAEIINAVRSGGVLSFGNGRSVRLRKQTELYRQLGEPQRAGQKTKLFPAITPGCAAGRVADNSGWCERKDRGNARPSGLIGYDFDGLTDAASFRTAAGSLPYVRAAWISASGRGVAVLCRGDGITDAESYKTAWRAGAVILERDLSRRPAADERAVDRAPSNLVSLRFLCHDAGVVDNPQCEPLPWHDAGEDPGEDPGDAGEDPGEDPGKVGPAPTDPAKRIEWVRTAPRGEHHNRARASIFADLRAGLAVDDERAEAYTAAIGRGDRAEVDGLIDWVQARLGTVARHALALPAVHRPVDSEEDLAHAVHERAGDDLAWVPESGEWRHWTGEIWRGGADVTTELRTYAAAQARRWWVSFNVKGEPKQLPSRGCNAVARGSEALLAGKPGRIKRAAEWDADRRVIGLPDGQCAVITADGCEVRRQRRGDRLTRRLPVGAAADWRGGDFARFLEGVPETDWLQRAFGYALICDGSEDVILWLRGAPRSGKSTLIAYITGVLGTGPDGYARALPADWLLAKRGSHHAAREAALHGARFAAWSEGKAGGVLDAERLKTWSGGDVVTANFMRRNPFSFVPRLLLAVVSNDDLALTAPDPAVTERLRLVDGWRSVPADDRRPELRSAAERGDPAVCRWLLEGAVAWARQRQESGGRSGLLPESAGMRTAKAEWERTADPVSAFLAAEYVRVAPDLGEVTSDELYKHYRRWMDRQGMIRLTRSEPAFKRALRAAGVAPRRRRLRGESPWCYPFVRRAAPGKVSLHPSSYVCAEHGERQCQAPACRAARELPPEWHRSRQST